MTKKNRRRQIITSVLVLVGVGLLVIGGLGIYDYYHRTQTGIVVPDAAQTVVTDEEPSENKPVIAAEYAVPANEPRVIKIDSLNVESYIQKVGRTKDGAMATPNNVYFTGWYTGSVSPGDEGVSILNGHVGGRYNKGVFVGLKDLKADDTFSIQMGDLSWRKFSVVSVNSYTFADTAQALLNDDPAIAKELHLITCDGVFDDVSQTYDKRVVLVAKRVD